MPQAQVNGVSVDYAIAGNTGGEPLLLIMGLAMQRIAWPEAFVQLLVDRGHRVISFDNRDVGLSQRFEAAATPSLSLVSAMRLLGMHAALPYTLADIADDAAALLTQLRIATARVVGISMGGMIAQHLAARHPQQVHALTLMATSSGRLGLPLPSARVLRILRARPTGRVGAEDAADYAVRLFTAIGSPRYPTAPAVIREHALQAARRASAGGGVLRQLAAIIADGDRRRLLRQIVAPCQILHGDADPMVPIAHGRDLARNLRHAEFHRIEGWGHDLPQALWPEFADRIGRR